jgi:tetratricopeptide (TPR) repeat protein
VWEVLVADRIALARDYLNKKPGDRFGLYTLAMELRKVREWEECFKSFEKLLELYPDYGPAFYHYAQAKKESGNRQGAIPLILRGLEATARTGDGKTQAELKDLHTMLTGAFEDDD